MNVTESRVLDALASLADEVRELREAIDALGARPSPLLDSEAAAEQLGVPASWVLTEARAGRIPHRRLGKYVRYDRGDLLAWSADRAVGPIRRNHRTKGAA